MNVLASVIQQVTSADGLIYDPITLDVIPRNKLYIFPHKEGQDVKYTSIDTLYRTLISTGVTTSPYDRSEIKDIDDIFNYGISRRVLVRVNNTLVSYNSNRRIVRFTPEFFDTIEKLVISIIMNTQNQETFNTIDIVDYKGNSILALDKDEQMSSYPQGLQLKIIEKKGNGERVDCFLKGTPFRFKPTIRITKVVYK